MRPPAPAVIAHVLILWAVIGAAGLLAVLVHRQRPDDAEPPEHGLVLGFVSAAYGLLLGLLVLVGAASSGCGNRSNRRCAGRRCRAWPVRACRPIRSPGQS